MLATSKMSACLFRMASVRCMSCAIGAGPESQGKQAFWRLVCPGPRRGCLEVVKRFVGRKMSHVVRRTMLPVLPGPHTDDLSRLWHDLSRDMSRLECAKSIGKIDLVTMSRLQTPRDGSLPPYHSETHEFHNSCSSHCAIHPFSCPTKTRADKLSVT
jgi:hypothetical protein